jgi:hypothetical protein
LKNANTYLNEGSELESRRNSREIVLKEIVLKNFLNYKT